MASQLNTPDTEGFVFEEYVNDEHSLEPTVTGPLTGTIRLNAAGQLGSKKRWVDIGGALQLKYEKYGDYGKIFAEGEAVFNLAFRLEEDPNEVINDAEIDFQVRELYWNRSFEEVSFTVGNLITAWSIGDMITLSDRLSVSDRSQVFFADPEDVISGQNSIKLDWYRAETRLSAVLVPFPLYDRVQDGGHPYSITPGYHIKSPSGKREPELAFRVAFDNNRTSFSLLTGWVNNREPILEAVYKDSEIKWFKPIHKPYLFAGLLATAVYEPFLIKSELMLDKSRPRQAVREQVPDGYQKTDGVSLLIGFDYNLGELGTLMFEAVGEYTEGHPRLQNDSKQWRIAQGWSVNFLNDRLKLDAAAIMLDSAKNVILRLGLNYELNHQFTLSAKYNGMYINKPNEQYELIKDYDRMELALEFHF